MKLSKLTNFYSDYNSTLLIIDINIERNIPWFKLEAQWYGLYI